MATLVPGAPRATVQRSSTESGLCCLRFLFEARECEIQSRVPDDWVRDPETDPGSKPPADQRSKLAISGKKRLRSPDTERVEDGAANVEVVLAGRVEWRLKGLAKTDPNGRLVFWQEPA